MAENTYNDNLSPEKQLTKYSYSNIDDSIISDLFSKTGQLGKRVSVGGSTVEDVAIGAFDIGWEGYSFDGVDSIVSTGHLLKLISDKIDKIGGDGTTSISEHAATKATSSELGHTYITDSYTLSSITEANRSYTAASITAIDSLHTYITQEYKDYIASTVLGGEVTDKSLDTIKELSEWITNHGEEAANLVAQLNEHEKLQATINVLGHSYLAQTEEDITTIADNVEKLKISGISAYLFITKMTAFTNELAVKLEEIQNNAYTYAGQVATTAQENSYAYAASLVSDTLTSAKDYANSVGSNVLTSATTTAQKYTDNAIKVSLSWQII